MKMKKIASLLTACAMLCTATAVLPEMPETMSITASAEESYTEGTYELLTYRNYGDYIEITGCDESATEVVIPSEIDGVPVTSIGDYAFCDCTSLTGINVDAANAYYTSENGVLFNKDGTTLLAYPAGKTEESYSIPDSVTSIGSLAFYNCPSLTAITIPDSVTSIGSGAFDGCTSLTAITIPDSVMSIGDHAFAGCPSLTEITIENPDCWIYYSGYTIIDTATIYGYTGSTAEAYAASYDRNFVALDVSASSLADLNGDSTIDATDASALLIAAANAGSGAESGLTAEQEAAADLNGDGAFDASDASLILMYAAYTGSGGTMTIEEFLAS